MIRCVQSVGLESAKLAGKVRRRHSLAAVAQRLSAKCLGAKFAAHTQSGPTQSHINNLLSGAELPKGH